MAADGRTDWQLPVFRQYLEDFPDIGGMGKRSCHWKGLHPLSSSWDFKVLLVKNIVAPLYLLLGMSIITTTWEINVEISKKVEDADFIQPTNFTMR